MTALDEFIGSGTITVVVLAILGAEVLAYTFYFKRLRKMLASLFAGACVVLALRAALLNHSNSEVGIFLALGFVFHILEVWQWLKTTKRQPQ
jgi:Na+-translocating ferredoxin:NAD+ oxidoreductase RnfE subunit